LNKTIEKHLPESTNSAIGANNIGSQFIAFERKFATLSDEAIGQLDLIAVELNNSNKFLIVRALSVYPDAPLTKNRLNSVKSYLKLRGVDPNRIVTEALRGEISSDDLKIVFAQ
jgi:hypothetical protein